MTREKQIEKAKKILPDFMLKKTTLSFIEGTTIDSKLVSFVDDNKNKCLNFSGFIGTRRNTYNITFTFYEDETIKTMCNWNENYGESETKFMRFFSSFEEKLYSKEGEMLSAHEIRNTMLVKNQIDSNGKKSYIIDHERSGEVIEDVRYVDGEYITRIKTKSGKVEYSLNNKGYDLPTTEEKYEEKRKMLNKPW